MFQSRLHKDVVYLLKEIFPGHVFLYEYPYYKLLPKNSDLLLSSIATRLKCDIYDKTYKILYEIQGIQHYQSVEFFGGIDTYYSQKFIDKYKRQIATESGCKLIEIPYDFIVNKDSLLSFIHKKTDYE